MANYQKELIMTGEKRKNRSDVYQYSLLEIAFSHEMLDVFSNNDSIADRLNPFQYNEDLLDLEDELKVEFWRIVEDCLTPRQKQVIRLHADGYTQMEIAKILNVNQSSITKSLHGNVDYKGDRVVYGGSSKRLKKIIGTDTKIKDILERMSSLRAKKW
jgi:predicted transcriptional regulator